MKVYSGSNHNEAPYTSLVSDWFGQAINPALLFRFELTSSAFIFSATRSHPALCHPEARAGIFLAELWKYDVAEFFLTDPITNHYLEFNLSPEGAHWSAEFRAPREAIREINDPAIISQGERRSDGWNAQAALPLAWLQEKFHFGPASRLNATFILDSPHQRFLSASDLGEGEPDFHRPDAFPTISIISEW